MPTKRQKRTRGIRADIAEGVVHFLKFGELPAGNLHLSDWRLTHPHARAELKKIWDDVSAGILSAWREARPGSRPWGWWQFDAPRLKHIPPEHQGTFYVKDMIEHRKILGGTFVIAHEGYNYVPSYDHGIPYLVDLRSSARPIVESQAAYLKRTRRLTADEKRRLRKKDYEPEILDVDPDSDLDQYTQEEFEELRPYLCEASGGTKP